ncbi:MAG: cytochrome c biogenesis protein CcsA [Akkermansiaceae bacterium]|nr:cytochrome c biogenesis protein CcsA [Akkermansiaceae bacterium]
MPDSSSKVGRVIALVLAVLAVAGLFSYLLIENMPKGSLRTVPGYAAWSEETLQLAETLPIQDGGRVKPLSTYAGFAMLGMHGARSMKIADDKGAKIKLTPTAWMLDALVRPMLAIEQPTFRIDNSKVLEAIGVEPRGRRDRYSYKDLEAGREKLGELAQTYAPIDAKERDPVQTQIVDLETNVRSYESLLGYFAFARNGITLVGSGKDGQPDSRANVSAVMMMAPEIQKQLQQSQHGGGMNPNLRGLLDQVLEVANYSRAGLPILPPFGGEKGSWRNAGAAIMQVMSGEDANAAETIADIEVMESFARHNPGEEAAFRTDLATLRERIITRAEAAGESKHVELEASYFRRNWFLNAMVFFLVGTITALAMWTAGRHSLGQWFSWTTLGFTLAGLACCVAAITTRCIIMERPPVGNLYDTIIFIASSVVAFALIVEWLVRRRFALGIAPVLGLLLIILARRYEVGDAKDHLDPLVAVLDSNFWLTIHVITITLGYSAGLLSAFLSTGYVFLRGFGLIGGDQNLRRSLTRAVYGMLCLTLFLSLVGTVLGGIWANYSWGRFWGWDPKENGALLIVLWTLAILHARLGGYLREWGLHLASVFTAVVVTFSWWHVNFLGVGLHNYGFTSGKGAIWAFYAAMLGVLGFGVFAMVLSRRSKPGRMPS